MKLGTAQRKKGRREVRRGESGIGASQEFMNNTSSDMRDRYVRLLMARSPQERLRMGCSMFDTAKQIVKSAILSARPGITFAEMKRELFLRFYGQELAGPYKEKVLKRFA